VSEAEGQEAAQLASETSGVLKVVTLYEYLDQAR
jgi:osmotically-inducible protein OsmY